MKSHAQKRRLQQTDFLESVPDGDPLDQGAVLDDQAAPGVVDRRHVLAVGLFFLLFVFPLGEGIIEELSSRIGVES